MYEEILFLTRIYYFRMQIQVQFGSQTPGVDCCAGIDLVGSVRTDQLNYRSLH